MLSTGSSGRSNGRFIQRPAADGRFTLSVERCLVVEPRQMVTVLCRPATAHRKRRRTSLRGVGQRSARPARLHERYGEDACPRHACGRPRRRLPQPTASAVRAGTGQRGRGDARADRSRREVLDYVSAQLDVFENPKRSPPMVSGFVRRSQVLLRCALACEE